MAGWYIAFRNFVIAALLVALIYLGIRMAITSIAEEKAHYKRMLKDWLVSFVLVLFIHFFIYIALTVNDTLVSAFYKTAQDVNMGSLYDSVKVSAHAVSFKEGWTATIAYVALVWFMVKYAWKYIKRLLSVYILVILSPLVSISYAIDKIKDNRAQSLSKWLKEIAFTILIQSVHALIYTVFMVGIVKEIVAGGTGVLQSIGLTVFLLIAIKFMDTVEDIFERIFGFQSSNTVKEVMDSSIQMMATFKLVKQWARRYWGTVKWIGRAGKNIANTTSNVTSAGLHMIGKHNPKVQTWINNKEEKERIRQEAINPQPIKNVSTMTGSEKTYNLELKRQKQMATVGDPVAQKAWASAKGAVGSTVKGMSMLISNPLAAVTMLKAGATSMRTLWKIEKREIRGANKTIRGTFTGSIERENKQRRILYKQVVDKDIALGKKVREIYNDPDSFIIKGYAPNASYEQRKQAKNLQTIVNYRLAQASKIIPMEEVATAVNQHVMETTKGKRNETTNLKTLDTIVKGMEKNNRSLKVNEPEFHKNLKEELQRAMLHKTAGEVDSMKFGEDINKQLKEMTKEAKNEAKQTGLKGEKLQQEEEKILNEKVNQYIEKEENLNEILKSLDGEDISNLMTRAINREGSIERDYEFKFEPEAYEKAVKQTMEKSAPKTLEDLTNFAEELQKTMTEEKRANITPVFAENVKGEIETMKKVLTGEIKDTSGTVTFSKKRAKELRNIVNQKDLPEEQKSEALFEALTAKEKRGILVEAAGMKVTKEMEAELEKYNKVIEQTIELREAKLQEYCLTSNVEEITQKIQKKHQEMIQESMQNNS